MVLKRGERGVHDTIMSNHTDDAILYAAQQGAHIINMSFAVFSNHTSIGDALEYAHKKFNCVLIASSGNDSTVAPGVYFPASHPLTIAVALTNENDRTYKCRIGPELDLSAPGNNIITTAAGMDNEYDTVIGTSQAAPFVGGIAGLMLSINPCLNNEEVQDILNQRADKVNLGNPYQYYNDPFKPGFDERVGHGRINAQAAVNTAEAMHDTSLDLYIKDHYSDFGYPNSYPLTARFDDWSDIWVRNQPDGHINQEMEEIEYSSVHDAYVYVKVLNKSCVASDGTETLGLYWTKSSTGTSWPQNWNGSDPAVGNKIDSVQIPVLGPGEDTILEFSWTIVPSLGENQWGTCIMARINTPDDPITSYPDSLAKEIRLNNNVAVRNLYVMDIFPGKVKPTVNGHEYPYGVQMYSGNVEGEGDNPIDITFDVPFEGGPSIAEEAEVRLFFSEDFWTVFEAADFEQHEGVEIVGDRELLVTSNHAAIRGLEFAAGQREWFYVGFNFLTEEIGELTKYRYHVTQVSGEHITGSMNFNIIRAERDYFEADAGPDDLIYEGQSTTLNASDIGEAATYNWYDSNDSLIYTGKYPTVSPTVSETYKLEVIADADLHKDYDEVTVAVNPYAITTLSPNPTTSTVDIGYDAEEAGSAYVMIYPVSGATGHSYILDTQQNQITLNVSSYLPGVYTVILVCDGQIVDSETLSVQ